MFKKNFVEKKVTKNLTFNAEVLNKRYFYVFKILFPAQNLDLIPFLALFNTFLKFKNFKEIV